MRFTLAFYTHAGGKAMDQYSHAVRFGQALRTTHTRQIGALPLILPILDALRLRTLTNATVPGQADIDLGQILVILTLSRLLAPQPLYQIQSWLTTTVLPQVLAVNPAQLYDMRLGRALDRLSPQLGEIWAQVVSQAVRRYKLDLTVLHWDLTSIYFEGAYTDSQLAAYGYSRDHRPDTKQVTLQADVTHEDAVPILYAVLPGNTADITRPRPHLAALLRFLSRRELADQRLRPILVSDCKMITPEAIVACHRAQLGYLGPLPPGAATDELLRSVPLAELAAHPLAYRPARVAGSATDFVPYQGVWRPYSVGHDGTQVTDRALIIWSKGKQHLDEQKRKTALKRLLNGLAAIRQKLNTRRYKQRGYVEERLAIVRQGNPSSDLVDVQLAEHEGQLTLDFRINRGRLAQAQLLDGRYALATNTTDLDADQTLRLFKGQDGVEKRFRTAKGPLRVHPLFVRSDARIEGLVLVTMLAVLVRAILERLGRQHGLALSADKLLMAFADLQAVDLIWADGSQSRRVVEVSTFQAQVLEGLGWPLAEVYAMGTEPAS
jgi:transposase